MAKDPLKQALKDIRRDAGKQARRAATKDESEDGSAMRHLADDAIKSLRPQRWWRV